MRLDRLDSSVHELSGADGMTVLTRTVADMEYTGVEVENPFEREYD